MKLCFLLNCGPKWKKITNSTLIGCLLPLWVLHFIVMFKATCLSSNLVILNMHRIFEYVCLRDILKQQWSFVFLKTVKLNKSRSVWLQKHLKHQKREKHLKPEAHAWVQHRLHLRLGFCEEDSEARFRKVSKMQSRQGRGQAKWWSPLSITSWSSWTDVSHISELPILGISIREL